MKIYKLPDLSNTKNNKEYCLGCEDLNTNAVYIVYGRLSPNESNRVVTPLEGHEAILYLIKGEIVISGDGAGFTISTGEAFHIRENESVTLENISDKESIYITAGGNNARQRSQIQTPEEDKEIE